MASFLSRLVSVFSLFPRVGCAFMMMGSSSLVYAQMERDPETRLVVPSKGQLAWHEDEMAVFFHMNPTFPVDQMTFAQFDPVALLDAVESVGGKHIVVVAKHVNGFCWWPTKATRPGEEVHTKNIALTRYKEGAGDVIREIFEEARKRGVRPGLYLATRDDHYGAKNKGIYKKDQKAYNDYYMTQATELSTQYGELAEWWIDGSSNVKLGQRLNPLLLQNQPNAAVFQGTNASLRWVGNEHGHAYYPQWNVVSESVWRVVKGAGASVSIGDPDGVRWMPAEVDTTLSTGWFGGGARSLKDLMEVYYASIGHGAGLLINLPVLKDGTLNPAVVLRGKEFGAEIKRRVGYPLHCIRDQVGSEVLLEFGEMLEIDHVIVEEDLRFGERVRAFHIEGWDGKKWVSLFAEGFSMGRKQIRELAPSIYSKVRLSVTESVGEPRIRGFSVTRSGVKELDLTPSSVPKGLITKRIGSNSISLKWEASKDGESGIKHYEVFREGVRIGVSKSCEYEDKSVADVTRYRYAVCAVNGQGVPSAQSVDHKVMSGKDEVAPQMVEVSTLPGRKTLLVRLNENLSAARVADLSHYVIKPALGVVSAKLSEEDQGVILLALAEAIPTDGKYRLYLTGVADDAGSPNVIAAKASLPVLVDSFGMVRHWKMDHESGESLRDSSVDSAAVAKVIKPQWVKDGVLGAVLKLDKGTYVNAGSAAVQTNFSLALWVNPASHEGQQVLISKERSGVRAYQFRLYLDGGKPAFTMSDEKGRSFGLGRMRSGKVLPLHKWSHLAVVNDGDIYQIYIDGKLVQSRTTKGIIQQPYNPASMLLGAVWDQSMKKTQSHFIGLMSDVRIYKQPLPLVELQQIMAEQQK